jgi:hypothetical protein
LGLNLTHEISISPGVAVLWLVSFLALILNVIQDFLQIFKVYLDRQMIARASPCDVLENLTRSNSGIKHEIYVHHEKTALSNLIQL